MDIAGLNDWELPDWIAPEGDELPDWLAALRKLHADALAEYMRAVSGVVDTADGAEADARAWRREVRDAVAVGKEPPPPPAHGAEVGEARVQVAEEDALFARRKLAEVSIEVLGAIRMKRSEFDPDHFYRASPALRNALFRGPDGLTEAERVRRERLAVDAAEPSMVDLHDPDHAPFTGDDGKELADANAA